jgi:hypothetical protein
MVVVFFYKSQQNFSFFFNSHNFLTHIIQIQLKSKFKKQKKQNLKNEISFSCIIISISMLSPD